MKKISKTDLFLFVLIALTFVVSIIYYPSVPNTVPIHWNAAGQIDGWGSKWVDLFLIPGINLGILALMIILPSLDPLKENYNKFKKEYDQFKVIIVLLFTFLYGVIAKSAISDMYLPIESLFPIGMGVFFSYMGYLLPKIEKNWFVGIKTPWTLASDTVWKKTHSLAGKLFMIAGAGSVLSGIVLPKGSFIVFLSLILVAGFFPVIYSYFLWRSEQKSK